MSKPSGASDNKPRALLLAPEAPYPSVGGGALRTASLVEYLSRRYRLDCVVFREPDAPDPRLSFPRHTASRVEVVELRRHSRSRAARAWRNLGRIVRGSPPLLDRFGGYGSQLEHLIDGASYDLAVIEHFWCAPYASIFETRSRRVVLDLHNIESELCRTSAEAGTGIERAAFRRFAGACAAQERRWLPRFTLLLAASEADAVRCSRLAPGTTVAVYPNAIPLCDLPRETKDDVVIFSGNLEYHPNHAAVRYFAEWIWPELRRRRPGLRWRIVGKNPAAVGGLLNGLEGVDVAGPVDDAVAELARAKVAVAPLVSGSGTRVKILEAWAAGLPVVSTTLGAEGLGAVDGVQLFLADDPARFAALVDLLLDQPELAAALGGAGRRLYEERYTWEAAWRELSAAGI